MKIEKGIISSAQLMFLIIGLLEATTLTAAYIIGITKKDTWLVLIIGFIIISLMLLVYTSLSNKYPRKNLIEINEILFGKYFGKVMSILYIYFFWFLIPANVRFISDFFSTYLFPQIETSVFVIAIILISIYTVKKGIEVIARTGFILSTLSIITAIFITIFTIGNIRFSNFLPVFQLNFKEFIQGINLMVCIPFGEIIVFLMIFPYVDDLNQVKKSAFLGLSFGSLYFLIIILRNTAVLGNIASIHVLPSYQVARLINIGEAITRVEVLIAVTLLFNVFLKVCIYYYATVLSIAQIFNLQSYKPLIIPVGIISLILSISMYNSPVEEFYAAANIYPIYSIPFIILFPIISLIIASIKQKHIS